ncbi:microtubule-associated protein Jupiter-like [Ornithodoros turicata]|uniref:Putative microtubule-associated protein jupiter n=1 Tax=Ornithodoros turicata TaxID=34597 RepID=A0A2R5LFS7_9ACAR
MAPVYDFRHVELDKVGRGKRMVKAPESSDIFGIRSPELGPSSCTPRKVKNYQQSSVFTGNGETTPARRRLSSDNSQERLFGGTSGGGTPQDTPKRIVDRMKSNIFTGVQDYDGYSSNGSNSPSPPNGRVQ